MGIMYVPWLNAKGLFFENNSGSETNFAYKQRLHVFGIMAAKTGGLSANM
jgi:hypothetical protein